jgi:poly(3-hydroxybutyrate) depolymerase
VLVLEPNYRGSAGYGEKFRSLNVRNLGVGDAWDVVSGVDSLIAKGIVDPAKVGTMGWSQGGYISAFLTTHDAARFKAVSVGAGHFRLDDVLREHGHSSLHAAVSESHAVGGSGDLRQDVADHLHQEREGADASSSTARPTSACRRPTRSSCTRAVSTNKCRDPAESSTEGFAASATDRPSRRAIARTMEHNLEWYRSVSVSVNTRNRISI